MKSFYKNCNNVNMIFQVILQSVIGGFNLHYV